MKTKLSVNLNKVALIRNSRDTTIPSVVDAAKIAINAGAEGITVHPRPDQRHIRPADVRDLAHLLAEPQYKQIEFNIEGNPYALAEENGYPGFMALVNEVQPDQATLVPDDPNQLTLVAELKVQKIRVSLFMDPDIAQLERAARLGAERIEYYTGPYADAFPDYQKVLQPFIESAEFAAGLNLGINAGHDLNLDNLAIFCREVPNVAEVSIGHAIITDALWMGLDTTIRKYCAILAAE